MSTGGHDGGAWAQTVAGYAAVVAVLRLVLLRWGLLAPWLLVRLIFGSLRLGALRVPQATLPFRSWRVKGAFRWWLGECLASRWDKWFIHVSGTPCPRHSFALCHGVFSLGHGLAKENFGTSGLGHRREPKAACVVGGYDVKRNAQHLGHDRRELDGVHAPNVGDPHHVSRCGGLDRMEANSWGRSGGWHR